MAERIAALLDTLGITVAATTTAVGKASKGLVAVQKTSATSTGLFNSPSTTDAVNVSLVQDRWYRVTYRLNTISPSGVDIGFSMDLKKSPVNDLAPTTGTAPADGTVGYTSPTANQGKSALAIYTWQATATESIVLKMVLNRLAGSATYNIDSRLLTVEDLGAQV